jgi:hypothetical protein
MTMTNKVHENDLTEKEAHVALDRLHKKLSKLSSEEAHDQLISILMRCMYADSDGNFLWAHDLPMVKKILKAKPAIKKLAMEWFTGVNS